jgi:hypothetical protein
MQPHLKLLPPLLALLLAGAAQAQTYTVLCVKTACGHLKVNATADRMAVDYSYRNNGRGPTQTETFRFAPDGSWQGYSTEGVSTYGARIDERFERKADGRVTWRSPVDSGSRPGAAREAVFLPISASPAWAGWLARRLLAQPGQRVPALPVGQVSIEPVQRLSLPGRAYEVGLYAITGLDLAPRYVWLREDDKSLFADVSPGWGGTLLEGAEGDIDRLSEAQKAANLARLQRLARELPQPLPGLTVIENVRWFDAPAARRTSTCWPAALPASSSPAASRA